MSRYIDAEKVHQFVDDKVAEGKDGWAKGVPYEWAYALTVIDNAPTADVVEVRHGEWVYHECVSSYDGCKSGYSCSVCSAFVDEEAFDTDEFHKAFCGNCGAKMDGERREE